MRIDDAGKYLGSIEWDDVDVGRIWGLMKNGGISTTKRHEGRFRDIFIPAKSENGTNKLIFHCVAVFVHLNAIA